MSGLRKKSVYTPVFYLKPDAASPKRPFRKEPKSIMQYLDKLSRKHVALAQMVEEAPSSRPASPELQVTCGKGATTRLSEEEDVSKLSSVQRDRIRRIESLRTKVIEAFENAKRSPANGHWSDISQLLRTSCTAGRYRYANGWTAPQDFAKDPSPNGSWILAETEEEWNQWERRYERKQHLKHRVHTWQQGVEPSDSQETQPDHVEPQKSSKRKSSTKSVASSQSEAPKQTSLQFKVSKRSSAIIATSVSKPPDKPPSEPQSSTHDLETPPDPSPMSVDSERRISDISDMNFLPPSFPSSQLQTSTPKIDSKMKVPSIPQRPDSSLMFSANINVPSPDFLSQRENRWPSTNDVLINIPAPSSPRLPMTSSPSLPSTPTKPPNDRKRRHDESPSDDAAVKKARTSVPLRVKPASPSDPTGPIHWPKPADVDTNPTTPEKKDKLPTLTELLASRQKGSPRSPTKRARTVSAAAQTAHPPPPSDDAPSAPSHDLPVNMADLPQLGEDLLQDLFAKDIAPVPVDLPQQTDYNLYDVDLSSPAKSLSSIAGSDSEDSGDEGALLNNEGFQPICASTQAGGGFAGGMSQASGVGFGFGMYNSQYDVEGEVDRVSELLERDVDFNGWLKDVSVADDAGESDDD